MKLSISNIAWSKDHDEEVYRLIAKAGFAGVDVAPGRVWSDPHQPDSKDAGSFITKLSEYGLEVGAMQSLLFQRPELTMFDSEGSRSATLVELKRIIALGASLGVSRFVFGSPKNRLMGEMTKEKENVAEEFFREAAEYCHEKGTAFCIEPNPTIYGGDFITTTKEGVEWVARVDHPGLKLNLDLGTVIENEEDVAEIIKENSAAIAHVHLSLPYLKPLVLQEEHLVALKTLKEKNYQGWVAIEMVTGDSEDPIQDVQQAVSSVAEAVSKLS